MVTRNQTGAAQERRKKAADQKAIRRFHVRAPEAALVDHRRMIAATCWSEMENVAERVARETPKTRSLRGHSVRQAQMRANHIYGRIAQAPDE